MWRKHTRFIFQAEAQPTWSTINLRRVSGNHVIIEHDHVINERAHSVYNPPLPSPVVLISFVVLVYDKQ